MAVPLVVPIRTTNDHKSAEETPLAVPLVVPIRRRFVALLKLFANYYTPLS